MSDRLVFGPYSALMDCVLLDKFLNLSELTSFFFFFWSAKWSF